MILNKAQAESVYSAMCALTNVGSIFGDVRIAADHAQQDIRVQWGEDGLTVGQGLRPAIERYAEQSAFAAAYGLIAATIDHDPSYTPQADDWTLGRA